MSRSSSQVYTQANRLKMEIQQGLDAISSHNPDAAAAREVTLAEQLNTLRGHCDRLQSMVVREPAAKRAAFKLKVDQLAFDCRELQQALGAQTQRREKKAQQERDREELLSRKFSANTDETSIMIDAAFQENHKLKGAGGGIDDLIANARDIYENLADQGATLKRTRRRLLDLGNTLGLTNTVMRMIEQRTTQDKYLFWAGATGSLVLMYFIYSYFG